MSKALELVYIKRCNMQLECKCNIYVKRLQLVEMEKHKVTAL